MARTLPVRRGKKLYGEKKEKKKERVHKAKKINPIRSASTRVRRPGLSQTTSLPHEPSQQQRAPGKLNYNSTCNVGIAIVLLSQERLTRKEEQQNREKTHSIVVGTFPGLVSCGARVRSISSPTAFYVRAAGARRIVLSIRQTSGLATAYRLALHQQRPVCPFGAAVLATRVRRHPGQDRTQIPEVVSLIEVTSKDTTCHPQTDSSHLGGRLIKGSRHCSSSGHSSNTWKETWPQPQRPVISTTALRP